MTHKMTSKEKKEIQYIDDKYKFMHSFTPLLTILETNSVEENEVINIDRDGYRYNIEIRRYINAYTDNRIYISRISLDINEGRQKGLITENCFLVKYKKHYDRILEFPLMLEKKVDIPLNDYGIYDMPTYNKITSKPSYCYFCDDYYKNLRSHFKTKKHEKTKIKCVSDELINKLNKDCIMNICEYL